MKNRTSSKPPVLGSRVLFGSMLAAFFAAACTHEVLRADDWSPPPTVTGTGVPGGSSGQQSSGGTVAPTGMPCDVSTLLSAKCTSCHKPGGLSVSLLTRDDMMAKARTNPALTNAEVSVKRMADQARPMPPGGTAPPADTAILQAWIGAGYPTGTCSSAVDGGTPPQGDSGPTFNPYDTPDKCSSGQTNQESQGMDMQPGRACGACHGPAVMAGTIYPTAHEPNNCVGVNGTSSNAQIFIIGADAKSYGPFGIGVTGNFKFDKGTIPMPYTVRLVLGTKERVMVTKTSNGDCNLCHTLRGSQGAPGRMMLPL
jgi:hypothetical protein